jgi:hypothetical protein
VKDSSYCTQMVMNVFQTEIIPRLESRILIMVLRGKIMIPLPSVMQLVLSLLNLKVVLARCSNMPHGGILDLRELLPDVSGTMALVLHGMINQMGKVECTTLIWSLSQLLRSMKDPTV